MTQPTGHLLLGYTVCPFISAELERSMAARDFMDARAFICGRPGAYEVIDSEGAHCVVCGEHAAWLRSDPHLTRLPYSIASVTA